MKFTIIAIILGASIIGGVVVFSANSDQKTPTNSNVSILDGKQVIEIEAKGGYNPRLTSAKAGIPTVLKLNTRGTFDCSSAIAIPSLGYQKNLPPSGETIVEIPPQNAGSTLAGLCAMGMYNFSIQFN